MAAQGKSARVRSRLSGSVTPIIEQLEKRTLFGAGVHHSGTVPPSTPNSNNGGPVRSDPNAGATNDCASSSQAPVNYATGLQTVESTDLSSNAFGVPWGQTRVWTGLNESSQNGNGWMVQDLPYITIKTNQFQPYHEAVLTLVGGGASGQEFEGHEADPMNSIDPSEFTPRFTSKNDLIYTPATTVGGVNYPGEFRLTDADGNTTIFYDVPRLDPENISPGGYVVEDLNGNKYGRIYGGAGITNAVTQQWFDPSTGAYNATGATNAYRFGAFKGFTSASGALVITTKYTAGNLEWVQRTDGSGTYERFYYDHTTVTNNVSGSASLISKVLLKKATSTSGPWTTMRSAEYTYYTGTTTSADSAYGRLGDLKLVAIKDGNGDVIEQKYYRYYKQNGTGISTGGYDTSGPTNDPSTTAGTDTTFGAETGDNYVRSGLRSVFEGAAFARLAANRGNVSAFGDYADADVDPYAQYTFQYQRVDQSAGLGADGYPYYSAVSPAETIYRVIQETAAAEGCSTCSGGLGTFKFEYYVAGQFSRWYPGDEFDTNAWYMRTIEYLPDTTPTDWSDNDQNIVYTNEIGQVMLKVQLDKATNSDESDDKRYLTYYRYDGDGRETFMVHPSALIGYAENLPDLVDFDNSLSRTFVAQNSGLIEKLEYETVSSTATATVAGDVVGHFKNRYVRKGYAGTDVLVFAQKYYKYDYHGSRIYPLAKSIEYRDVNGVSGDEALETVFTYGRRMASSTETNAIQWRKVSHPAVASARNGSEASNYEMTWFDEGDRPTWIRDASGYITYIEYDNSTGAVHKTITDVQTSRDSDSDGDDSEGTDGQTFSGRPSGTDWDAPTGTHLHRITTTDVDGLGRVTTLTDPNGNITYTVFKDATHEVRAYHTGPGTFSQVGPIYVVRNYWPTESASSGERQVYSEQLTSSATPSLTSSVPNGNETLSASNIHSLARSLTNDAGQVIEADSYFSLSGISYVQATSHLGSSSNDTSTGNYHATLIDYNAKGLVKRTRSPSGTITRKIYDGLGRLTSIWVGTDDTPTGSGYWPSNMADTDMSRTADYNYDDGGIGDSNLTDIVQHVAHIDDESTYAAGDRRTRMSYDWRDRLVASKQGYIAKKVYDLTPGGDIDYQESASGDWFTITVTDNNGSSTETVYAETDLSALIGGLVGAINSSSQARFQQLTATNHGTYITLTSDDPNYIFTVTVTAQSQTSSTPTFEAVEQAPTLVENDNAHRMLSFYDYDNLGNVTRVEVYAADEVNVVDANSDGVPDRPSASLRRGRTTYAYDDRGRIYATHVFSVDPINGDVSSASLDTNLWYDARGNVIKTDNPGGLVAKSVYDGANRLTKSYATDGGGDPAPGASGNWDAADDVGGDIVFTQTETQYDSNGNAIFTINKERFHDAAGMGELGSPTHSTTGSISPARSSYVEYYYDAIDRLTGTAVLGTNGGTLLSAPPDAAVPTRSDTKLVTTYAYDNAGRLYTVIDPRGIETRNYYDALGRTAKVVEGYTDGTPTNSSNRTTEYTYDGSDHLLTMKAVLPDSAFQETKYVYGVGTAGGSAINSNDVLAAVRYPSKSTGSASTAEQETFTVNALGERKTRTDRNGSVHTYSYDVLGRMTSDAVTTLGSGVNGTVRRLETAYDDAGRPFLFTSYSAAAGGTIVNQVQRAYNGLGQLVTEYQSHSGAVNTSTTPKVQYAYSEMSGGANHSRLTKITYPNGRIVRYEYSSGIDSDISRLSFLADDSSGAVGAHLEEYSYLGLGTVVKRAHPQPGVDLTYIKQTGESVGDAGDQYTGLDPFGRIVDQRWRQTSDGSHTDRFTYTYNRNSDRLSKTNDLNDLLSEYYLYDRLDRLVQRVIGGDVSDGRVDQLDLWDYDALGNMTSTGRTLQALLGDANLDGTVGATDYTALDANIGEQYAWWRLGDMDLDGTVTAYDYFAIDANLDRTDGGVEALVFRTHNAQNQITELGGATSFTYDASGNLTSDQLSRATAYDAWNRLASAATANYEYDALGRRIEVTYSSPTTDPAVDFYYSNQGQVLEERESGASVAKRQYVWSAVYVDAMVLRDQDSGTDGTLDERLYAQQDANFNVTSVIDTSGTVVERYTYEAFGQFTVIDADWSSDADGVSDVGWVHLHQGGRWDKNAKLYHFGARDYDPELVRWTSPDPLGYVDGANLYQYEVSDPTGMLDPMGTATARDLMRSGSSSGYAGGGGPGAIAIEKPSEASRVSHFGNATTRPATNKAKDQSGLNNGTGTCTTKKCPATQPQWGYLGADGLWHDALTDRLRNDADRAARSGASSATRPSTPTTRPGVYLCFRKAGFPGGGMLDFFGIDHEWVRIVNPDGTSYEVGLGNANGVPGAAGQTSPDLPFASTYLVNHSGQVAQSCIFCPNADPDTVRGRLPMNQPRGPWIPAVNDCNTEANDAVTRPKDFSAWDEWVMNFAGF